MVVAGHESTCPEVEEQQSQSHGQLGKEVVERHRDGKLKPIIEHCIVHSSLPAVAIVEAVGRKDQADATEVFRSYCGEHTGEGKILQLSNLTVYRVPIVVLGWRFQSGVCLDAMLDETTTRTFPS